MNQLYDNVFNINKNKPNSYVFILDDNIINAILDAFSLDIDTFKTELEDVYGSSFDTDNDYKVVFQEIENYIKLLHFKLKHPYFTVVSSSAIILFFGLVLIKICFWRRMFCRNGLVIPPKNSSTTKVE